MKLKSLIMIMLGAAMLGGCCSACKQRTKNAKPLEGTVWHLIQIEGRDVALDAGTFDITLDGGRLSGIGACNRLMGSYTVEPKLGHTLRRARLYAYEVSGRGHGVAVGCRTRIGDALRHRL